MDRNERFQVAAVADKVILCGLAEEVTRNSEIALIKGPSYGMVMTRVRETVEGIVFNLGEVLVTEAEVTVNGCRGYLMVLGREKEKALAGAILDAAVEVGHPMSPRIVDTLEREKRRLETERTKEWSEIARTKVNFEVMPQ